MSLRSINFADKHNTCLVKNVLGRSASLRRNLAMCILGVFTHQRAQNGDDGDEFNLALALCADGDNCHELYKWTVLHDWRQ